MKDKLNKLGRLVLALLVVFQPLAWAGDLPEGWNASQGVTVDASTDPHGITVTAVNENSTIDWGSFNVGAGKYVKFVLPNETSSILNTVTGGSASDIWGGIMSDMGRVFLVNMNGIHFHEGATLSDTTTLIASTLNLSKENFMARDYTFEKELGSQIGKIINEANLIGKNIALIAEQIQNKGVLEANLGTVALGAGTKQVLSLDGSGIINLVIEEGSADALITNESGAEIRANGGKVLLTAKDLNNTLDRLVNNDGLIEATRMVERDGVVELVSNGAIFNSGEINTRELRETGATFKSTGILRGGKAYYHNLDGAAFISGGIGSDQTDTGNLIVDGDITLLANNLTFNADSDSDGSGVFYMTSGYTINGGNFGLTIKTGSTATAGSGIDGLGAKLGSFSNLARVTLDRSTGAPTYTSDPTATTWDIDDFRIASGTKLNRFTGEGSVASPYAIYDVYGLQAMNGYLNDANINFSLAKDISAYSTSTWNGGSGFVPVGNCGADNNCSTAADDIHFLGDFDGNNHVIWGLTINLTSTDGVGLFGYTAGDIANLGMRSMSISGRNSVGGFAGTSDGSLTNSYSSGSVSGAGSVGGLFGGKAGGTVSGAYSDANVTASVKYVGGLIGYLYFGTVTNSYALGSVTGPDNVGGLVGRNDGGTISKTFAAGAVTHSGFYGGLVGRTSGGGTVTNSYWDKDRSTVTVAGGGGTGKTTAQMKQEATFSGWTFGDGNGGWVAFENSLYPHLDYEWSQSITTLLQLQNMSFNLGANYTLGNDLDASATEVWNSGAGFNPIGDSPTPFTGDFDGGNYTISGLKISRTGEDDVGLFGYTNGSAIQNIGLKNVSVVGHDNVGGLVGNNHASSISNSYVSGSVSGSGTIAGGLIGNNDSSSIDSSYASSSVSGVSYVGGLVGYNLSSSSINHSYASGSVSGNLKIGGLIGGNDSSASVSNSYATGVSTSSGDTAGGLIGLYSSGTLTNNWWFNGTNTVDIGDDGNIADAQIGKATAISDFYSTGSGAGGAVYSGWDFYNSVTHLTGVWESFSGNLPHLTFEHFTPAVMASSIVANTDIRQSDNDVFSALIGIRDSFSSSFADGRGLFDFGFDAQISSESATELPSDSYSNSPDEALYVPVDMNHVILISNQVYQSNDNHLPHAREIVVTAEGVELA